MPKITYIEHDGTSHEVEASSGDSVMETALAQSVPGIDADCGGECACATCHVYVNGQWAGKLDAREEMEETMLELAENVNEHSRLSCQIKISDNLDGLVISLPEAQH